MKKALQTYRVEKLYRTEYKALQVLKTNEKLTSWRYYAARRLPPPANNDCDDHWSHLPHDYPTSSSAGERRPQNCRRQYSQRMRSAIHGA